MTNTTTVKLTKLQKELLEDILAKELQTMKEYQYSKVVRNSINNLLAKLERAS